MSVENVAEDVIRGKKITREEALELTTYDEGILGREADRIRKHFCGDRFDICSIVNGKSGKCTEDCKYCAQSAYYHTNIETYGLLPAEEIIKQAQYNAERGVKRYSIVTSGKKLSGEEVEKVCKTIAAMKKTVPISICASFGLLEKEEFAKLKKAGVERIHNNLETSENYFRKICTTHTFEDKKKAIRDARKAGLSVCSGGIMGLGESWEDRVDMALELRNLEIKSIPINMLNPIPGTPYEKRERLSAKEMQKIVSVFRFILPDAWIRMAGGRGLLEDKGEGCFRAGANAAITGDMLTTAGYTIENDKNMLRKIGYKVDG